MKLCYDLRAGAAIRNVKVKPKAAVLNMLKRLDKIRFRGPKRDDFLDLPESPTGSDTECSDDMLLRPQPSIRDNDEQRDPASLGTLSVMQDLRSESECLNEVKGHLEIALLEKHFLQEELRKLREETNVETLKQELEKEHSRRLDLEQKMSDMLKTRCEDSPPHPPRKQQPPAANGTDKQQKETVCSRLQSWLYDQFGVYIEDFRFQPEENTVEAEEPLSAKRLTENMLRLSLSTHLRTMMSDPQLKERSNATVSRRIQPVVSRSSLATIPAGVTREEESSRSHSTKKGAFHEVFNLPENEKPLPVCENGWRCCLINRDRKMPTDYIRNGMLYVTENCLCFESSSTRSGSSKKNKVIKLVDITDIQKYKVLSVLPGSGMGISIATPSTQKPLVFGAMVHRDEAFETIFTQYMKIMTTANPEM
ncbi:GRAM domain-containing protein 4 [Carassius gibelio]|uniref:GRAM domain-containing protein 4 n=1 Tax=Carassius gibelio TaxID=101364 RepID=UPI0022781F68|nr:GRAM domain-containing protein 4 [Carassius gibelio]